MLVITKQQYQEMIQHATEWLPAEGCGLLAGVIEEGVKTVKKVYLLDNTDNSSEHFSMDPKQQFEAVKDMRSSGWVMLGNFHSHPSTPARPSEEDKRLAFDCGISYLILSLIDKANPMLKSFKIQTNEVKEELIEIVEG